MTWPSRLVLVRHAESRGNVIADPDERARFALPTHAYPLTERGRAQARLTGDYLRQTYGAFDVYYTSYYRRAQETMRLMFPEARIRDEEPRLREAERGIWATMTRREIAERFPEEIARKEKEGLYHYRPIGGQNWPDIEERAHSMLGTLRRDCGGKKVLMVVHGHWLILFQRLIHHFPIEEALRRYEQATAPNASVTVYRGAPWWRRRRLVLQQEHFVPWQGRL